MYVHVHIYVSVHREGDNPSSMEGVKDLRDLISVDGYIDYRMIAHELHHAYVWERTFDSPGMSGQGDGKLK